MKLFDHKSGQHIEIESAKIYVEKIGNPSKEVLLLLHGGFGNMEDFNTIIPKLEKEFRIIGIDSRGQGKSTLGNKTLSYEIIQKDIETVLQKLNINKLSILGISDGGIVAYRLACFSSLKIEKLITIGSRWNSENVLENREILEGVTAKGWKKKFPEMFEKYQKLNSNPDFNKLTDSLIAMWVDQETSGYPNEKVKNIKCPTLIIRGDNDPVIKRKFVFELSELIENSALANIAFAGHVVYLKQMEILMKTINHFLKL